MTGKWKSKPKKVVETSLGKAPKESEKGPDLSHLRKPIHTSIHGLKQILNLFQTATTEVQEYITYECDILYECKICRTIFRSLANFILHKREYCREKYPPGVGGSEGGFIINDDVKTSDEESRCATPIEPKNDTADSKKTDKHEKKTILPIIDKLLEKQKINLFVKDTMNEDLTQKNENIDDDDVIFVSEENNIILEKISSSDTAVYQTSVKNYDNREKTHRQLMKNEVLEIHNILDNNQAVLDSAGKISPMQTGILRNPNVPKLTCTECKFTFSTEKTLTRHIKYKHNKTCIVFPCPDCRETFSNAWSVYRHLYKVHRRTASQVRRMRHIVHSSGIRKDQEPEKKKRKVDVEENEENQWMNNFEGDYYFQMCGGCGKRFERKAALQSHSQMCTKRIAVCNSIKNMKTAKSEKKIEDANGVKQVKGAAKRKQQFTNISKINRQVDEKNEEVSVVLTDQHQIDDVSKYNRENVISDIKITKDTENSQDDQFTDVKITRADENDHSDDAIVDPLHVKVTNHMENDQDENMIAEEVDQNVSIIKVSENDPLSEKADVTITKHSDDDHEIEQIKFLPEIEIFTISDDSEEFENQKMKNLTDPLKFDVSEEYKEYVNDDADHYFIANAQNYLDINQLKCIPCDLTFLNLYRLLRHMSDHYSWYRYQCSKCSFMSFHKDDCTTHAYSDHSTPTRLMDSTVLPIPKWKVLCTSHDFKEASPENQMKEMPTLKPIKENAETIVLEDDEMPDITESIPPFHESVILSDDETKFDNKKVCKASTSQNVNNRPIRNRTKSVKTVQNDFIYEYDLGKVFKYNSDGSVKNKKKKNLGKV